MRRYSEWMRIGAVVVMALAALGGQACAKQAKLDVSLGKPVLLAGKKQTEYLKVGLTGFEMDRTVRRTPVNVAIVLDKSGSMSGRKIEKAKEAALIVIDRLNGNDIVSVIAYDTNVTVVVPATKLSDAESIRSAVRSIEAGGSTALFAGVSKGASEVRKFFAKNRVNRVILLSDGLANVGPSSVGELASLGSSLGEEGISVTTIGLGLDYNEDLMAKLALRSDGSHAFAETAEDIASIFNNEFGDVLSVVAQEVDIRIECASGVRPVKALGREADIAGQIVTAGINHLYSNQEKYVMIELEVPATVSGRVRDIATVRVSYANMETETTDRLTSSISARFTDSEEVVENETNPEVMVEAVKLVAAERSELAVALRDAGKRQEAQKALRDNVLFLKENARRFENKDLETASEVQEQYEEKIKAEDWRETRKQLKEDTSKAASQRGW